MFLVTNVWNCDTAAVRSAANAPGSSLVFVYLSSYDTVLFIKTQIGIHSLGEQID